MSDRRPCRSRRLLVGLLLVSLVACLREEGPAPVAWDRTRCAYCGMLVSDPAWAAQRRVPNGEVLFYDDPGCLMVASDDSDPDGQSLYFRHHDADRWLRGDRVSFVEAGPSPMGYDLGAVESAEAPRAMSLPAARLRALAVDRERRTP